MINIHESNFSVCGVIIFEPPLTTGAIGHFATAVKTLHGWVLYDDMKSKEVNMSGNKEVSVSSILYAKLQNLNQN